MAINTNLAAIAGAATATLFWYLKFGKPDITMACNGMLGEEWDDRPKKN